MTKKIQLYHFSMQDRSDRVRWLLEEMQVPYENKTMNKKAGELLSPEYLKLNPMGRVPTLVEGDLVLFESAAICLYLADKYSPGKLAPAPSDPKRAHYLQWMAWSVGSLECVIARMFTHVRTEEERAVTHAYVKEQCKILAKPLIETLSKHKYILGEDFSAADIMLAAVLPGAFDDIIKPYPVIEKYMKTLMERPAAVKALVFE